MVMAICFGEINRNVVSLFQPFTQFVLQGMKRNNFKYLLIA